MKHIILIYFALSFLFCHTVTAQSQAFKFQAIARNTDGTLMTNRALNIRISIFSNSPDGTLNYQETQAVTTDRYGLFNLEVGNGVVKDGQYSKIDWAASQKYIQTEVDLGSGYTVMGVSKLLTVPYAIYSFNPGTPGRPGVSGAPGAKGEIGLPGIQGIPGSKGDIGAPGAPGIQGLNGPIGSVGATGITGPAGAQGGTGNEGAMGSTGYQGIQGLTGANGPIGATGLTGKPGANGMTGQTGLTGTTGIQGTTGLTGTTGITGAQGPIGLTGPAGPKGDIGTDIIPIANGGTGTKTPSLVSGNNNITLTGSWPNQIITLAYPGIVIPPTSLSEINLTGESQSMARIIINKTGYYLITAFIKISNPYTGSGYTALITSSNTILTGTTTSLPNQINNSSYQTQIFMPLNAVVYVSFPGATFDINCYNFLSPNNQTLATGTYSLIRIPDL